MMKKVEPHEYFRLDFDQIVEEGKRQEELLTANVGEYAVVKNMHDFYSNHVLPFIISDDWVFESANRFATEFGLDCIRLIRLAGAELSTAQQKLIALKEEVVEFVAKAKLEGYIDSFGTKDLEKASDFIDLLEMDRMPANLKSEANNLHKRLVDQEEMHVLIALRSIRDLYETVLPRVMYVVKRAIKSVKGIPKKPSDNDLIGISEDITWYSKYIPSGHALNPIFGNLQSFYKIARNVGNHHKGFTWIPERNLVLLEDINDPSCYLKNWKERARTKSTILSSKPWAVTA